MKLPHVTHPKLFHETDDKLFTVSGRSRDGAQTANVAQAGCGAARSLSVDCRTRTGHARHHRRLRGNCMTSLDGGGEGRRRLKVEEIIDLIESKFEKTNGLKEMRKLFRSNDPSGEGRVSKEAFARIVWCLCGYVTPLQISNLIKRLNFQDKASITLADLVGFYRKRESCAAVGSEKSKNLNQERSMSDSVDKLGVLRDKLYQSNIDPVELLPASCMGAYVLPGHVARCFEKVGMEVEGQEELVNIFRKVCGNPFAMKTETFLKLLEPKVPKNQSTKSPTPKAVTKVPNERSVSSAPMPGSHLFNLNNTTTAGKEKAASASLAVRTSHHQQAKTEVCAGSKFDGNLADFIQKKLDEGQNEIVEMLSSRDQQKSGMISKTHLRNVFKSLGLDVKAVQLEHFLSRAGIRRKDGFVNYLLLLRRLRTRTRLGLFSKVMRNQTHIFHASRDSKGHDEVVSAELLECRLIGIFQKNFFLLLSSFKESDKDRSGLLHVDQVRKVLEQHFGISAGISDKSWQDFVESHVTLVGGKRKKIVVKDVEDMNAKTHVRYNQLLSKFDVTNNRSSSEMEDMDDPWIEEMDISFLREHKVRYLHMMSADPNNHHLRHDPQPLEVLERQMVQVLLNKFDDFKKEYDLSVREDYCRVDKEKFDYIMFRCGFLLTPSELHDLWLSMPITRPMESLSFKTICQHAVRLYYTQTRSEKFSKTTGHAVIVEYLLEKIRKQVVGNWDALKKKFRSLDPCGTSRVFKHQFVEVLKSLGVKITKLEVHYLVETLESRISEKSDYMKMMGYFVKKQGYSKPDARSKSHVQTKVKLASKPHPVWRAKHQHHRTQPPIGVKFKAEEIPQKVKTQAAASYEGSSIDSAHTVMKRRVKPFICGSNKIGSLSRMLRKEDAGKTGKVPVSSFLDVLGSHGVNLANDQNDMFKFLNHYDKNLSREIAYGKFLKALA